MYLNGSKTFVPIAKLPLKVRLTERSEKNGMIFVKDEDEEACTQLISLIYKYFKNLIYRYGFLNYLWFVKSKV